MDYNPSSQCAICGGYRGPPGKSGLPNQEGYPGKLGPCGHEESRGPRGRPGSPVKIKYSKELPRYTK